MAKLTRTALKGLIKECLIEILTEGIASDTLAESARPRKISLRSCHLRESFFLKKELSGILVLKNQRTKHLRI